MQTANIINISGDGQNVTIEIQTESGELISITQSKMIARQLWISQIRNASSVPEKDCDDSIDHWNGHCACK